MRGVDGGAGKGAGELAEEGRTGERVFGDDKFCVSGHAGIEGALVEIQFPVRAGDAVVGHPVREIGLPREALLNVIVRGERAIPPRGSTVVQPGDQLHVLVRQEAALDFRELMRRWRTGPVGPPERPRRQPATTGPPSIRPARTAPRASMGPISCQISRHTTEVGCPSAVGCLPPMIDLYGSL